MAAAADSLDSQQQQDFAFDSALPQQEMVSNHVPANEQSDMSSLSHVPHQHYLPPPLPTSQLCSNNSLAAPATAASSTVLNNAAALMICVRCLQPIAEPFLLLVGALPFHASCLTCAECACPLYNASLRPPPGSDSENNLLENNHNGDLSTTVATTTCATDLIPYGSNPSSTQTYGNQSCGTCFFRDDNVYCRIHYIRRFVKPNCAKCTAPLSSDERVMRVEAHVFQSVDEQQTDSKLDSSSDRNPGNAQIRTELRHFHVSCFTCSVCHQMLQRGDLYRYVAPANILLCRDHIDYAPFEAIERPHSPHSNRLKTLPDVSAAIMRQKPQGKVGRPRKRKANMIGGEHLDQRLLQQQSTDKLQQQLTPTNNIFLCQPQQPPQQSSTTHTLNISQQQTQSQRAKRMRTSFKHQQLKAMKSFFTCNQNPDAKDLKQLSTKTGLSKRVLQVWFQNARAKNRRHYAKSRMQESSQHQQSSAGNSSNNAVQLLQPTSSSSFIEQLGATVASSTGSSCDMGSNLLLPAKNLSIPAVQSLPAPPPPAPPPPPMPPGDSFYHPHPHHRYARQQYHMTATPTFASHNVTQLANTFSASTTLSGDANQTQALSMIMAEAPSEA